MKTLKLTMAMGVMLVVGSAFAAGTFDSIPFNTPTYSADDPLGVTAIQEADTKASNAATAASNAAIAATAASNAAASAQSKADVTEAKVTAIETSMETVTNSMTKVGDTVVVGSMKGTPHPVGLLAGTNSIVLAVDRDSDGMTPENGQILLAADNIKLDTEKENIYIGEQTLATLLENAGSGSGAGESNKIEVVQTNGVDLPIVDKTVNITIPAAGEVNAIQTISTNGAPVAIDENRNVNIVIPAAGEGNVIEVVKTNGAEVAIVDKTVDITIPAPGDANVIESITTNGVALPVNGKTIELPNYVLLSDLQDGITFDNMTVSNLTINGKKPSLEGHTHDDKLDATNGVAFGDFKVYPMPSGTVGQTHTIITHESMSIGDVGGVEYKENEITHNGESYEFSSDTNGIARLKDVASVTNGLTITASQVSDLGSYKNPTISAAALTAIDGIANAQDIATIKSTLTNFLNQFVIQPAP